MVGHLRQVVAHGGLDSVLFLLSVYDIIKIIFNVEIGFSDVIFSGLLVARVFPLLV